MCRVVVGALLGVLHAPGDVAQYVIMDAEDQQEWEGHSLLQRTGCELMRGR